MAAQFTEQHVGKRVVDQNGVPVGTVSDVRNGTLYVEVGPMDNLGDAERGAGFGLVRTVYMVVGALGSVVVGVLSDVAGWSAAFGLLSAFMGVAFAATLANRLLGLDL